jgi:hypothetical protein
MDGQAHAFAMSLLAQQQPGMIAAAPPGTGGLSHPDLDLGKLGHLGVSTLQQLLAASAGGIAGVRTSGTIAAALQIAAWASSTPASECQSGAIELSGDGESATVRMPPIARARAGVEQHAAHGGGPLGFCKVGGSTPRVCGTFSPDFSGATEKTAAAGSAPAMKSGA